MPEGKFFEIQSELSDLVLTVKNDEIVPGKKVDLRKSKGKKGQLWFEDELAGRIRSYQNDSLVLQVEDDHLIVSHYEKDEYMQKWRRAGDIIRHSEDHDVVLDVTDFEDDEGADVMNYKFHGKKNQKWQFNHHPARYCYIKSHMNGKVVDIARGRTDAGTKIVMWDCTGADNQLWWEDKWGNIRSKLNNYVFTAPGEGKDLYMQEHSSDNVEALWAFSGSRIYNKANPGIVLDIRSSNHGNGAKLIKWAYQGSGNQHWDLAYV